MSVAAGYGYFADYMAGYVGATCFLLLAQQPSVARQERSLTVERMVLEVSICECVDRSNHDAGWEALGALGFMKR